MLRYVVLISVQLVIVGNVLASPETEGAGPVSGIAQTRFAVVDVGAQQRAIKVLLGGNSPTKLNLMDQI
ncbi:MAG: hypothetical protein K8I00_12930, partial [Candidatus Omnitrophica bacterium]|nr:hypothetical protein [Candidatus Omnitrophota bacterium]